MKKVLVLGNDSYAPDSLPIELLPQLIQRHPDYYFIHADPNEDWDIDESVTVIDTVINIDEPRIFASLDAFADAPRVSMHDFDALSQLQLLVKMGRVKEVKILGLPPNYDQTKALDWIGEQLS